MIKTPEHIREKVKEARVKIHPENSARACYIVYYWHALNLIEEAYSEGLVDGRKEI